MKVLKNPWKDEFLNLVSYSKDSIKMTSPFVKENICNELIQVKNPNSKIELYTSFKLKNIYSGSLDLNGLENIIIQNGIVRNTPKLHSKIYLFDNKKAVITSSNLTNGGMLENYEYGIYTENSDIVNQIVKDFNSLSSNKDIGIIRLEDINTVKNILAKLPKQDLINIPEFKLDTPENYNDVIELPDNILHQTLSGWKLEVFKCIQIIKNQEFSLNEMNQFIPHLQKYTLKTIIFRIK